MRKCCALNSLTLYLLSNVRISAIIKSNNLSPQLARDLRDADTDGDGEVSIEELLEILTKKAVVDNTNKNLKKLLLLAVIFILFLARSNLVTSLLAVHLGKELNSSPGGTLLSTNGETVSTKVIGVNEFF